MIRRLSRTALPVVAATILAALFAQPVFAAGPTVTHSSSEGPDAQLASETSAACGIGPIRASVRTRSTTIRFPTPTGDGRITTESYAQLVTFTHTASGTTAKLSLAGVVRTYRKGGAFYLQLSGRSLNQHIAGVLVYRNGVEIKRTGRSLDLAGTVCGRLGHGAGGASHGRGASGASAAAGVDQRPERTERGRSGVAHAAKAAR